MLELDLGNGQSIFYDNNMATQSLFIERTTALYIFERASIIAPAFSQNALGLYTFVPVGMDGEAIFGSFTDPQFNLRARAKRCTWNPSTCGLDFGTEKIPTCPINHQSEVCTDVLWDSCWEKLLGIGNGVRDFDSSTASASFLAMAVSKKMRGIGNDFWYLMSFGGHPYIQKAHENKWYRLCGISDEKWNCFYEMMQACGGHLTMIDALKDVEKRAGYNIEIKKEWVRGSKYIGDAMALFDSLIENKGQKLETYTKAYMGMGTQPAVIGAANPNNNLIICVTRGIFNRYKEQLRTQYKNIPDSYYLTLHGETYGCGTCGSARLRGVLEYDGHWVVCCDEWGLFDQMTCVTMHRATLIAPGALGLAYDVSPDQQRNGMGMEINKWTMNPYKGTTFFSADFRAGAAILDPDYIRNACLFLPPAEQAK